MSNFSENPQRKIRIFKIIEDTCVHRNTVGSVCARTRAIIRWGFSLENERRTANGCAGGSLGFKYS